MTTVSDTNKSSSLAYEVNAHIVSRSESRWLLWDLFNGGLGRGWDACDFGPLLLFRGLG